MTIFRKIPHGIQLLGQKYVFRLGGGDTLLGVLSFVCRRHSLLSTVHCRALRSQRRSMGPLFTLHLRYLRFLLLLLSFRVFRAFRGLELLSLLD